MIKDYSSYKVMGTEYWKLTYDEQADFHNAVFSYLDKVSTNLFSSNRWFVDSEFLCELKEIIKPTERYRPLTSEIRYDEKGLHRCNNTVCVARQFGTANPQ